MSDAMRGLGGYLDSLEAAGARRSTEEPAAVGDLRRGARDCFLARGFPTTQLEAWRFTSVAPITEVDFAPATNGRDVGVAEAALERAGGAVALQTRLVFLNGNYVPILSHVAGLPDGVIVQSLAAVMMERPDLLAAHLGQCASYEEHPFVALNTAFVENGAVVRIPDGTTLDEPIGVIFVSSGSGRPSVSHPRVLVIAGTDSRAAIVESYIAAADDLYFTNAVTELIAGPNTTIEHCRVQWESTAAFHVATVAAAQARESTVRCHSVSMGAALARNDVHALLDGEGAHCQLNGLYLTGGQQHVDNHTVIDHARPHSTSLETYKGVLDGASRGVFSGRIIVRQDAQQVVARQSNGNLLLSEDAIVHTQPHLQINADDVKCYHGATVGMLDDDALFYLLSRGLDRAVARTMLIRGFMSDVLGNIGIAPLRNALEERVGHRFGSPREGAA